MIVFHRLQGYVAIYFIFLTFLFTLAKFDIHNVTNSCITNCYTNLTYMVSGWDRVFIF